MRMCRHRLGSVQPGSQDAALICENRISTLRMAKTPFKWALYSASALALSAMSGESLRVFASVAHVVHLACCPIERKPRVGSQYSLYTFCNYLISPLSDAATAILQYMM